MIGRKRAKEVYDSVSQIGVDETANKMGLSTETIMRYLRRYRSLNKKDKNTISPKVLFFDIETAPMMGYIWGLWQQNVDAISQLESDWFIFCWSAKWMGQDVIFGDRLTSEEALNQDDCRVVKSLWNLFDEADIIVAHNCLKFDRKRANTRFLVNGMTPPSPYRVIDTLKEVKKEFAFSSNRMDFINSVLGLERKRATGGMELWTKCYAGDEESLKNMSKYCDQDIVVLEDLYYQISPWIRSNINFGAYSTLEAEVCSHCGSDDIHLSNGKYFTNVSKFPVYKCNRCGGYSRGRYSEFSLEKRKQLLTSLAR